MADGMRYLRRRRERAQRQVIAITITCGIAATALTVALGMLLPDVHMAPMSHLPGDLAHPAQPEDGAGAATGAELALGARWQAPAAHSHSQGKVAPGKGSPATHEGD